MNINLHEYATPEGDTSMSLGEVLAAHHAIMGRSGRWALTGEVALISDPDPELASAGSMQVWSKMDDQQWVYVTPDGVAVEAACPIGD